MGTRDLHPEYGASAAAGRLHHLQRDRRGENRLAGLNPLTSITIACQTAPSSVMMSRATSEGDRRVVSI
jgi:hypothetical protein